MPELLAVGDNLWATQNIEFRVKAFQSAAFEGLTEDRTRSHLMGQKLLALRAATTEAPSFVDALGLHFLLPFELDG